MAEKQDAMMDAPTAPAESAQEVSTPSNAPGTVAEDGSGASKSDNMAWVGSVKKDARKKGYDEGYQKAQEELRSMLSQPEALVPPSPQPPMTSQMSGETPMGNGPQAVSPDMVSAAAQQAQMNNRFGQIAQLGSVKYPDYHEKMSDYVKLAQEREQAGDPDLSVLMTMAANFGNEDLVHKVATDEDFRNQILETNPKVWASKLLSSNMTSPASSHLGGNPTIKVAAPPTSNLPKSSSYGDLGKMSSAERRTRQRKLHRG